MTQQAQAPTTAFEQTFIPDKSDFERLLEKDFKPETKTERFLLQRDMYWWQAERFFASGMYKKKFASVELVFAAMMYGLRFGWHPITSLDNLYPVNDKMTPSTQSMLGLAQGTQGGMKMKITETDGACEVTIIRNSNGMEMTTKWTIDDAKKAGLLGKDNWQKYPKPMLRWRAIADNLRIVFADALSGVLTTEEAQSGDFEAIPGSDVPKVNPAYKAAKAAAQNTGAAPVASGSEKAEEAAPPKPAAAQTGSVPAPAPTTAAAAPAPTGTAAAGGRPKAKKSMALTCHVCHHEVTTAMANCPACSAENRHHVAVQGGAAAPPGTDAAPLPPRTHEPSQGVIDAEAAPADEWSFYRNASAEEVSDKWNSLSDYAAVWAQMPGDVRKLVQTKLATWDKASKSAATK